MRYLELNNQIMNKKDGFFQLEKDQEALHAYLEEVEQNIKKFNSHNEKFKYLIDNNYYYNFYSHYNFEQIHNICEKIYGYGFTFASYMSASKFYRDYSLKTNDKSQYLEKYEDRVIAVALYLAQGDYDKAVSLAEAMIQQHYQPATPTFLNAGKKRRGEMISCFLLDVDDSLNSITFNIGTAMKLSKIGGGVALNLSRLRSRGESIKEIKNVAKGVVPVVKLLEDSFNYADQMGQRKGAGAAYLNIFHYDVEEFLDTKKINADEKSRIQTLSLGLTIPDKFFDIAKKNEDFYVFAPLSVYKAFGKHLDDINMDEQYEEIKNHPDVIKKKLNAREMLTTIAKTQFESGYPYIIYSDNANRENPLKGVGNIKMSNLCTEIFQIQKVSQINDYEEADEIGHDVCCVLGSLNIVNVMEGKSIEKSVNAGIDALTAVTDLSSLKNAPTVRKANDDYHSIGLGAMNLHGYLAKNNISYESDEAIEFVDLFFMTVNFYSIKRSMEIAKEKGVKFVNFEKSDYATGEYFTKYTSTKYEAKLDKVKDLFANIQIPSIYDWKELEENVKQYGLYHAYRLAIAPTQSISYVQNATPSIMPVVDAIEVRTYQNSTSYYPMPYLSEENLSLYKSAYEMDMKKVIDVVHTIQKHVDQGISTVLYVTSNTTTSELVKLYLYAHKKNLKSLYYTRTKNLTLEECLVCSI